MKPFHQTFCPHILFLIQYIPRLIEPSVELVILYLRINHTLEEETVVVPVEGRIILVLPDHVITEDESVDRLSIQDRGVKCIERVVLNHDTAMEILLLVFQVGYLRIDGYYGIGELEHIRQRVDKPVIPDQYVMASSRLEPSVAIAAQQDSRTGSMVEDIIFHNSPLRRAEQ